MNYHEFQWLVSYWIILIRPKVYKGLTTKLITSFSHESPRVTLIQSVHAIFTFLVDYASAGLRWSCEIGMSWMVLSGNAH